MLKRVLAVSLMALSIISVHHKPAEAAPLSTRAAATGAKSMVERVGDCRTCYRPRANVGYRHRSKARGAKVQGPRVQGWERSATLYRPRPIARASARWDPGFRFGAASWGDQRAWTYYGQW